MWRPTFPPSLYDFRALGGPHNRVVFKKKTPAYFEVHLSGHYAVKNAFWNCHNGFQIWKFLRVLILMVFVCTIFSWALVAYRYSHPGPSYQSNCLQWLTSLNWHSAFSAHKKQISSKNFKNVKFDSLKSMFWRIWWGSFVLHDLSILPYPVIGIHLSDPINFGALFKSEPGIL